MGLVERREQIEDLQLGLVAGTAPHISAHEVLEAEVEHVQVRRHPHRHRGGNPVLRVLRGHAAEVLERLSRIPQLQIRLRRVERLPCVREQLSDVRGASERLRAAGCVREPLELHVRLQRRRELPLLLELLRPDDGDRLPAHRGRLGRRQHRPGIELARLHPREFRRAHRVASLLQELDCALLFAERHEELHGLRVLSGAAEEDGRHQRALLPHRIQPARLRRRNAQALDQQLRRVPRPAQRAQHPRRFFDGSNLAEELRRGVALPRLLQAAGALDRLVAGLGVHQSSANSAARCFSDSGWLANFIASSSVTSPCLSSRNRQLSRLCMPLPSLDAPSR